VIDAIGDTVLADITLEHTRISSHMTLTTIFSLRHHATATTSGQSTAGPTA